MEFLKREFGDRFIDDPVLVSLYARDASLATPETNVLGVVFPVDEGEVVDLVKWAIENRVALFPQGSATSLSGNAAVTRPGVVVSFEKMTRFEIQPVDGVAICQPGVRLDELNGELYRYGFFFPIDPGSVRAATVGGAVANGAGGMRGVKYGSMRDWVLGLRVVTGRGDVLKIGCRTYKCRNGYDLVRLFVGSEGTLGLVTEAVLKLAPIPESAAAALLYYDDVEKLVEDIVKIRSAGIVPLFAEFLDATTAPVVGLEEKNVLFIGVEAYKGLEEVILDRVLKIVRGRLAQVATGWEASMKLLEPRRRLFYGQISLAQREGGTLIIEDVAVPISKLPEAVRTLRALASRHNVPLLLGGHVGDGNIHPATWFRKDESVEKLNRFLKEMAKVVVELGGTTSAEHGVGVLKKELIAIELGEEVLKYMAELKKLFDPYNVLNPGKVV
ncbi:MAG: FAD-linked oxidase C-terminal domain-containing protein [Pyrobaculum sp.]